MQSKKINELGTNVSPSIYDLTVVGDAATGQLKKITLNQIASLFGSVGGVSSVAMTVPTGLTVTGSPITTSGTLAVTLSAGYSIPTTAKQSEWDTGYAERLKWDGGASGLSAPTARTSLGLVIGTDVLAYRTFGTAANNNTGDFATAAQGVSADTAYTNRITGASLPLSISSNVISIAQATTTISGFLTTTDWNTFNGKQAALNGTGFVKATGTTISYDNSTYLTTTSASSTYLPLAGGTLTGALGGTSATFSSSISGTTLALGSVSPSTNGIYLNNASANGANYGYIKTNAVTVNTTSLILGSTYGYSTPVDALTIFNGTATFSSSVTTVGNINIQDSSVLNLGYNQGGGATLKYNSNGNLDITPRAGYNSIFTTGNVGIGTDSPEALLHLNKSASGGEGAYIFIDNSAASALGNKSGIRFGNNTGASFNNYDSYIEAVNVNAGNGAASLTFGTWNGASRGERMRITYDGNILVSTTTDNGQGKLQVNGAITATNISYTGEFVNTTSTTLNTTYYKIIASGIPSGQTYTLPSPTSNNLQYVIVNKTAFSQTISAGSGFTIYDMAGTDSASITLASKARCYIIADGSSFYQIF